MVGYLGCRGYRVWDPRRRGVYPVRDVEFEEGRPRRTLTDPSAVNAEESIDYVGVDSADQSEKQLLTDDEVPAEQGPSKSSSPSGPPPTSGQSHSQLDIPQPHPPDAPAARIQQLPPALRCSSCTRIPSARLLQSMDYEVDERRARDEEELWANIFILASTIKGGGDIGIPKTYAEAMNSPDDWYPPMLKEITSLQDRKCWSLVNRPENARIMNG
ncbi:hypothetical protein GGU10DRAFT_382360, partial [Lentinula aff. detonsa]